MTYQRMGYIYTKTDETKTLDARLGLRGIRRGWRVGVLRMKGRTGRMRGRPRVPGIHPLRRQSHDGIDDRDRCHWWQWPL